MAVKTLDQVLAELQGTYQPQVASVQQKISQIPGQIAEQEKGLQARQEQAFGDILGGARRRGLGFSGIPLAEQAKYTSSEFLPALARLRTAGTEQATSLQDAINGIYERRNTMAQQLVGQSQQQDLAERQFAEQQRQFNENLALQREQARRAAASQFSPSYGGGGNTGGGSQPTRTDPVQQVAYNDVATRMSKQGDSELVSDYKATLASANNGNPKDKYKVQIYQQLRPDLFLEVGNQHARYFSAPTSSQPSNSSPFVGGAAFGVPKTSGANLTRGLSAFGGR